MSNKAGTMKNSERTLTPKLRFPEFRNKPGWERSTVGELVATVSPPKKLPTSQYLLEGRFPIVDQSPDDQCGWTNDVNALIENSLPLIVFGDHTCILKLVNQPFAQGADGIRIFRPKRSVSTEYLYQFLCSRPLVMESYKRHFSILKDLQVFYPEDKEAEQQKIIECLSSLDGLITAEGRKLEALRDHKRGLMQQLFPQPGETQPRLRFPEFRGRKDWLEGQCSDIAHVWQGYGFPDRYQGQRTGTYPFYKVSDISAAVEHGGQLLDEAQNYIDETVLKKLKAKPVPAGTIVFAKIGEAIRKNRRALTTKPAVIDNNVAGVKAITGKMTDDFLFYLWTTVSLMDFAGGVVPAVSKTAIENIPVSYPAQEDEQQKIADCLTSLDTQIAAQSAKIDALKSNKRGLMQQLFPAPEEQ